MSSGFVSGGTVDNPAERDDAWRVAQQELEETRRLKAEQAQANDGKSLFEVLEANKAAKQEAFEEATKFKNQYRALDDDEAEYLDSILESTRKKEAQLKKETSEQLELFRRQREEAERKALEEENAGGPAVDDDVWGVPSSVRKRKKSEKDGLLLKSIKARRTSSSATPASEAKKTEAAFKQDPAPPSKTTTQPLAAKEKVTLEKLKGPTEPTAAATKPQPPNALALTLGYPSSDEED